MLPALILGYTISVPVLYYVYDMMGDDFKTSPLPTRKASMIALAIGIFVPALSAIIPIKNALSKNLNDSINDQRSKNSGLDVKIIDREKNLILPFVLIGSTAAIGCTGVYYFLPKAFLTLDYTLMLNMFFLILTGLILGITLLTNNVQGILEFLLTKIAFFWERKAMRILLSKNLMAHRARNNLTSIIYALTLGCIIVLLVAV